MTVAPAERDPRIDPVVGDILKGTGPQRSVIEVREWEPGIYVRWRGDVQGLRKTTGNVLILKSWRKWAATAQIIKRGDSAIAAECAGEKQ